MNINFKFGIGEIVEHNTNKGSQLIDSELLEVIAMTIDRNGTSYHCRYPGSGHVGCFAESELNGDPQYNHELGCYPPEKELD